MAGMLSDVLKILHARVTAPRFKPKASDAELMAMIRAFVQTSQALATILRDRNEHGNGRIPSAAEAEAFTGRTIERRYVSSIDWDRDTRPLDWDDTVP